MDAVEIFAEEFQIAQIVFDALPALNQRFVPRVLGGRGVRAGEYAVAVEAVVLPVQLFGEHQRVFLREGGKVACGHKAVV